MPGKGGAISKPKKKGHSKDNDWWDIKDNEQNWYPSPKVNRKWYDGPKQEQKGGDPVYQLVNEQSP
jgi:hypothetical protein